MAAVRWLRHGARAAASVSVREQDPRSAVVERLKRRSDFRAAADGVRASGRAFVLQTRQRAGDDAIRVGFTVSKKNGTATERNRIRRRLRELVWRLDVMALRPHSDYVLIGRRAALSRDFNTMLDDLSNSLDRLDRQNAKA